MLKSIKERKTAKLQIRTSIGKLKVNKIKNRVKLNC